MKISKNWLTGKQLLISETVHSTLNTLIKEVLLEILTRIFKDAVKIAAAVGLGNRINVIMQAAFLKTT